MPETSWVATYSPLITASVIFLGIVVAAIGIMVSIWLSNRSTSNKTNFHIGGLLQGQNDLQQGQNDLSAQIDKRFDQQREDNAKFLDQLGSHGHDTDGNTLFRRPL